MLRRCPAEWTRVLCVSISEHAVLRSMHCYKQVTLSTSETPVKEGLRRTFEMITRRHCFQRLHFVVKLMCAVKAYFVLDAEQSIAAAIFAEGLDAVGIWFVRECLFVFYAEHNNKIERGLGT